MKNEEKVLFGGFNSRNSFFLECEENMDSGYIKDHNVKLKFHVISPPLLVYLQYIIINQRYFLLRRKLKLKGKQGNLRKNW